MKINIHTHQLISQDNIVEILQVYPNLIGLDVPTFSIGIHPWYISLNQVEQDLQTIENVIQTKACLAIGECGLDKNSSVSLSDQLQVFQSQLLLAQKYKKAVILHLVSHFDHAMALKKDLDITVPLIVHGFRKSLSLAQNLIDKGFYLSFGSALLKSDKLQETFKSLPKERLFLETDDQTDFTIDQIYGKAQELVPGIEKQILENFKLAFTKDV
ncbi:TatD family hydrolase [Myroides sp. LJL119]